MSPPDALPRPAPLPPDLAAALARCPSGVAPVCRAVHWYPEVSSTNDVAAAMSDSGAAEGTVVIADAQTAGRGRLRRSWASPPGAGLYASVVLRPRLDVLGLLTIAAGVALAEGIGAATGLRPVLKWPNDLMVITSVNSGAKKLAGILAEAASGGAAPAEGRAALQGCVLGFGINLRPAAYPEEVAARATSLERELGRPVDRGDVLVACMSALAARYDDLRRGRAAAIVEAWRGHARPLLGRSVEWDDVAGTRRGVAEDIDDSGALLVRSNDGTVVRVITGDVRWM